MSLPSTALGFYLSGALYPNNSVVALTAIGTYDKALYCLTNLMECFQNSDATGDAPLGYWRQPDQSVVSN